MTQVQCIFFFFDGAKRQRRYYFSLQLIHEVAPHGWRVCLAFLAGIALEKETHEDGRVKKRDKMCLVILGENTAVLVRKKILVLYE